MNSGQQCRWVVKPTAPSDYIVGSTLPPLIAQLLYNRGVEINDTSCFLSDSKFYNYNPFLLPDMGKAVDRIYNAILTRENIAVYGDFDVDGITATLALIEGLSWLGAHVVPYIPNRLNEGHGQLLALESLYRQGVTLVITVDCGITAIEEAEKAHWLGLDLIITDHHNPLSTLPRAIAIIDAKLEYSEYPFRELAGVGIAYKLLQALYHSDKRKRYLSKLLDLVALGSVADMVPLISENRYLVKEGIRSLNKTKRLGIQELIKTSKLEAGKLDTRSISWYLGPRINAASRLGDATISYQLLMTSSAQEANELSMELEETNAERQNLTKETIEKAKVKLEDKLHLPILIDSDEDYALGVIGLVAGKLVDEFHKPAILISLGEDSCQGSCRSIDEFNLVKNLESCTDLLETFGGHPLAAGFTVKKENLAALNDRMLEQAQEQLSKIDLRPAITVDAEVPFSTLTGTVLSMIQQMEPFGQGNPTPVLLTKNVKVLDCYNFGNSNNYLSFKLQHGTTIWQAVDFHSKTKRADIAPYIDIIYSLEKRRWNGEETLRLNLLDFSPASS